MKRVTFCLACGAEVAADRQRCEQCGAPIGRESAGDLPRLHRRPPLLLYLLCGLAVAAALAAAAVWLLT